MSVMFSASLSRACLLVIPALIIVSVSGCQMLSVGDQACVEGMNVNDPDDACPYGPPGGPRVKESACPDIPQADPMNCTTTWNEVFDLFTSTTAGNCSAGGCHGSEPGARGLYLPSTDPNAFYDELKGYKGSQGYPYINEEDPSHSWILCNLSGVPGGGAPMPPPSGFDDANFAKVRAWAECGLKRAP